MSDIPFVAPAVDRALEKKPRPEPRLRRERVPWYLAAALGVQAALGICAMEAEDAKTRTVCIALGTGLATFTGMVSPGLGKRQ